MRTSILLCAVALALSTSVQAQELERNYRFGTPREEGQDYANAVRFASWLDDDTIVYWGGNGKLTCRELAADRIRWQREIKSEGPIQRWSVSPGKQRLAILYEASEKFAEWRTEVIDCQDGRTLFAAERDKWQTLVPDNAYFSPWLIVLTPREGKLIVCGLYDARLAKASIADVPAEEVPFASVQAYVLDETYTNTETTLELAAGGLLGELSVSPDDARICQAICMEMASVREIATGKEVFYHGKRFKQGQEDQMSTDTPFVSHVRHDGKDTVVYSVDGGWGPGTVHVRKLNAGLPNVNPIQVRRDFNAHNGHIEMDADFQREHIALTGTSTDITLLSFDGEELAHLENATSDRNFCIEFSPSGEQILVGSIDGTVSVFNLPELPQPAKPSLVGNRRDQSSQSP